jgi:hypothetical protein
MSKVNKFPRIDEFLYFVKERQNIHVKRSKGCAPPWTSDKILQTYRFTNVHRVDDRVTKWIHTEWLLPHEKEYDTIVFAMALARLVNLPSMLEELSYPHKWNSARFVRLMETRKAAGDLSYNNAYMINAVGAIKGQSKASYLAECVLGPLWKKRSVMGEVLRTAPTLQALFGELVQCHGFGGGFMSGQVVADIKYTAIGRKKTDWWTFVVSGPGSRRGMHWLCGTESFVGRNGDYVNSAYHDEEWQANLALLRKLVTEKIGCKFEASDVQNCLCEFSKYCKVKYLGRRAKQYFTPSKEPYD